MASKRSTIRITSYRLKLIAILTMLIDHTAIALLPWLRQLVYGRSIYDAMRGIGKAAFPLFCFLLVEGVFHTRNRWRYLGRIAVFAVLSELPSDLFFRSWDSRNDAMSIFSTLSLGLLTLIVTDIIMIWGREKPSSRSLAIFGCVVFATAALTLGDVLQVEYEGAGIALILMIFYAEKLASSRQGANVQRRENVFAASAIAVWLIAHDLMVGCPIEIYGLVAAIPVALYSGEHGSYRIPKWFFYAFYPAHLFVLIAIRGWIA